MIEKDRIETVWFFKDKPWVYVKAKNQDPLIIKVKGVQEHYKSIARQGVEFYTCDDDDLDAQLWLLLA
jgi:predicted peroxiredoxin